MTSSYTFMEIILTHHAFIDSSLMHGQIIFVNMHVNHTEVEFMYKLYRAAYTPRVILDKKKFYCNVKLLMTAVTIKYLIFIACTHKL